MNLSELTPEQWIALPSLFASIENSLMVRSMAAGNTPGRAWADDPLRPRLALAWDLLDWAFLAGQPSPDAAEETVSLFSEDIFPSARSQGIDGIAIFYDPPEWEHLLAGAFPEQWTWRRKEVARFSLESPDPDDGSALPPGFVLQRIDGELLGRGDLANLDDLKGWVSSFWHSAEDFLHSGYGYAALNNTAAASWCLVVFTDGHEDELAVATAPEFRGQRLGTAVAAACLKYGVSQQRKPAWHCWADNYPSLAIAKKIGFRPAGFINSLWVKLPD